MAGALKSHLRRNLRERIAALRAGEEGSPYTAVVVSNGDLCRVPCFLGVGGLPEGEAERLLKQRPKVSAEKLALALHHGPGSSKRGLAGPLVLCQCI